MLNRILVTLNISQTNLPGSQVVLTVQSSNSFALPEQYCPPCNGAGSVHVLVRDLVPSEQFLLHADQDDHRPQWPFIGAEIWKVDDMSKGIRRWDSRLLPSFHRLVKNRLISGCVRMACDSLLTTGLLQDVNRLVPNWLSKLVIHRLAASCFNKL